MAKLFRFSGYLIDDKDINTLKTMIDGLNISDKLRQFHVDESEDFKPDGEEKENCDLSLLERHFKTVNDTEFDRPLPTAGEKYKHFKIGKAVEIVGIARHTETQESEVVYRYDNGTMYVRPLAMFMSEVDRAVYPNAAQKYRFEKLED